MYLNKACMYKNPNDLAIEQKVVFLDKGVSSMSVCLKLTKLTPVIGLGLECYILTGSQPCVQGSFISHQ